MNIQIVTMVTPQLLPPSLLKDIGTIATYIICNCNSIRYMLIQNVTLCTFSF